MWISPLIEKNAFYYLCNTNIQKRYNNNIIFTSRIYMLAKYRYWMFLKIEQLGFVRFLLLFSWQYVEIQIQIQIITLEYIHQETSYTSLNKTNGFIIWNHQKFEIIKFLDLNILYLCFFSKYIIEKNMKQKIWTKMSSIRGHISCWASTQVSFLWFSKYLWVHLKLISPRHLYCSYFLLINKMNTFEDTVNCLCNNNHYIELLSIPSNFVCSV